MRRRIIQIGLAAVWFCSSVSFAGEGVKVVVASKSGTNSVRPVQWATKLNATNVSNFYLVTTNLLRGAQPNAKGMAELKAMGVRTVVNLRSFHSDTDEIKGLNFKPARLHMQP